MVELPIFFNKNKYLWLSSSRKAAKKVYFSTLKLTLYRKSLDLPEILLLP